MDKKPESKTSVGVAMLRVVHQLFDPAPKLLDDPVIVRLLMDLKPDILKKAADYQSPGARVLRAHVLLRNRYAEDCLASAAGRGLGQYVLLGAGLDTFAYRQPSWAAPLRIFELDHPASQHRKRTLLGEAAVPVPANLSFVEANLETDDWLARLVASGLDARQPVFFSWLGVMPYLRPETNRRLLAQVAALPASTEMVFTFSLKSAPGNPDILARRAEAAGEPWLTRPDEETLLGWLHEAGFSGIAILDPAEAARLYFPDRPAGLPPPLRPRIARVLV